MSPPAGSTATLEDHREPRSDAAHVYARLKVTVLAEGVRTTPDARVLLAGSAKPTLRVRSGSCGGLDVILPDGSYLNCPVRERFAARSPLELHERDGALFLHDARERFAPTPVAAVPTPAYYGLAGDDGRPLHRTGQLCSDRLGIGLTNICTYWRSRSRRCKFCSIGHNVADEQSHKDLGAIVRVVEAAYEDPIAPARHLLLGGGTPDGPDAGAVAIARAAAAVKRRWPRQSIYAMLAPPADLGYLELLRDSGVDEIGLNLELFSQEAAARFIPGKHAAIGRDGYLRALARSVELFGAVNTRSIMVVGLEPLDATLAGVELLASMGVLPILSPLRPLAGTELEDHPVVAAQELWELTLAAAEAAGRHDMPLGPVCVPCQSNTLTVPGHPLYRCY